MSTTAAISPRKWITPCGTPGRRKQLREGIPPVANMQGSDQSRRPRSLRTVLAARLAVPDWTFLITVAAALLSGTSSVAQQPTTSGTITVDITPGAASNSFVPTEALGAGIDRLSAT